MAPQYQQYSTQADRLTTIPVPALVKIVKQLNIYKKGIPNQVQQGGKIQHKRAMYLQLGRYPE